MLPNKTILPTILQFVAAVDIAAVEREEGKARPTQETLHPPLHQVPLPPPPLRYSPLTHYHITPLGGQTSGRGTNKVEFIQKWQYMHCWHVVIPLLIYHSLQIGHGDRGSI